MSVFALPRILSFWARSSEPRRTSSPSKGASERVDRPLEEAGPTDTPRPPLPIAGIGQREVLEQLRVADAPIARAAFETVYNAFFARLWRIAYRMVRSPDVAEETVHDVFLALWVQRETLEVRGDLGVYLYIAVRNGIYKRKRHSHVVDRHADEVGRMVEFDSIGISDPLLGPAESLAEHEATRALLTLLDKVSDRDREVLMLRWREGWTYDEIGQALGISSVSARVIVSRQQRRLRPLLERFREQLLEP